MSNRIVLEIDGSGVYNLVNNSEFINNVKTFGLPLWTCHLDWNHGMLHGWVWNAALTHVLNEHGESLSIQSDALWQFVAPVNASNRLCEHLCEYHDLGLPARPSNNPLILYAHILTTHHYNKNKLCIY